MAKFKYTGKAGMVGRFGYISKGQTVELRPHEVEYVLANSAGEWEEMDKPSKDGVGLILPVKTLAFDLSKIKWHLGLARRVRNLGSRKTMQRVVEAMHSIGCSVPDKPVVLKMNPLQLIDCIYAEARRLRWDQPDIADLSAQANEATNIVAMHTEVDDTSEDAETPDEVEEVAVTEEQPESVEGVNDTTEAVVEEVATETPEVVDTTVEPEAPIANSEPAADITPAEGKRRVVRRNN